MYRILIVDDEGLELQSLRMTLEKNFGEDVEIETGTTGRMAIELFESFRPDITLMDIQMPGINGIDAIKEIRRNHTEGKIVVLTAYDNFEYVQESVSLGVSAYLTKPVHRDELLQKMRQLMAEIDEQKKKRKENLLLLEKLDAALPMIEAGFIYSVLLRQDWDTVCYHYANLLEISEENGYFIVINLEVDGEPDSNVRLIKKTGKIYALTREIFRDSLSQLAGKKILVVVPCKEPKDEYAARLHSIQCANELQERLESLLEIKVSVGIGNIVPLRQLTDSYNQAVSALDAKISAVAHVGDLPMKKQWEEGYPQEVEYLIYDAITAGNGDLALQKSREFFEWMVYQHGQDLMDVKLKVLELVMRAEYLAFHRNGGRTYRFMERHGYLEDITSMESMDEIRNWFLERMEGALRSVGEEQEATTQTSIDLAKKYIEENYMNNLTLNDVSESVHISPYYFSKLFKDKTGQNFIEYLTGIRMEQAKLQLEKTELSVKEICMNVGYSDPNYFSRSFKKYAGMTPGEYRDMK